MCIMMVVFSLLSGIIFVKNLPVKSVYKSIEFQVVIFQKF